MAVPTSGACNTATGRATDFGRRADVGPGEKEDARRLLDQLPAYATWDDLMREIYLREAIARGLEESRSDKVTEVGEVKTKYGLPE